MHIRIPKLSLVVLIGPSESGKSTFARRHFLPTEVISSDSCLRYAEKEIVSVPAEQTYCEPSRPFLAEDRQAPPLSAQQLHDDILDAEDVLGKRIISIRLQRNVTIREENATALVANSQRWI